MDHSRVGSLYSLADYGLGESDIEDSDDESRNNEGNPVIYIPKSTAIHATQARIKTSARLVSYDEDEAETEKEKESENVADLIEEELYGEQAPSEKEGIAEETSDGKLSARGDEEHALTDSADHPESEKSPLKAEESSLVKIASIPAIKMPQLPPEPVGRCSNTLQEEIRKLLEKKHEENIDLNTNIQKRKDFRNPSIYKKLVSYLNLDETGSNYPKSLFDPSSFTEESFYENLSKAQKEAYEKKEKERAKQARTHVEFVSGTKKANSGEEPRKRKSKWDISAAPAPAPAVKTATPPTKVGAVGPGVTLASDAVKKAKVLS